MIPTARLMKSYNYNSRRRDIEEPFSIVFKQYVCCKSLEKIVSLFVSQRVRNILIIRFSSIGDIVLASPLIRSVRTTFPDATIDFLVKAEYADLIKYNPYLSEVHELTTNDFDELRRLVIKLRARKYDLIIDIHNSLRSRYARWFARAKRVTVINKKIIARFLLVRFKWNLYRTITSVADRYLETVRRFGVHNDQNGLEVSIPDDLALSVRVRLEKFRLEKYKLIIGIAPSARHATKRWLPERYVDLGVALEKKYHLKIFIFGSKDEHEYCSDIAQMINAALGAPVAESIAGIFTLLEDAVVMDRCDIIVCNDTGLLHMASARKRKVVAIFGSTVRELGFFPYQTEHRVVERKELACRPCSHIGQAQCPKGHFRCMNDIGVDDVFNAVQSLVQSHGTNTTVG